MGFRWMACTTTASARPLLSLYPLPLRQFSTTAFRSSKKPSSIEDLFPGILTGKGPGRQSRPDSGGRNAPPIAQLLNTRLPRMGPTAGRSVVVQTDIAQAFMRLRSILSQNNVRSDAAKQRFHERPGLKRKRLQSERHRRRFKEGFKRMVKVVMDMKKKGM